MSEIPLDVRRAFEPDGLAEIIANSWDRFHRQRQNWIEEQKEKHAYITATDTSTTTNRTNDHRNTVTIPKLTQIRDNLHSNYMSHLFPNDKWLKWKAYDNQENSLEKAQAIEVYMRNKTRESNFRQVVSQLLYDYIDYGNAFATCDYTTKYKDDEEDSGIKIPDYIGPRARRISPLDIEFSPFAARFSDQSFHIERKVLGIGEIALMSKNEPENEALYKVLEKRRIIHGNRTSGWSKEDWDKAINYQIDGFGSMYEYFQDSYVELLIFTGTMYDHNNDELRENVQITIADRATVIEDVPIKTWKATGNIHHVGWRRRPDNLWAMGPLDNLVGLQYRLDHQENLKDDALDLVVMPPLKIYGDVEEFGYYPGSEIAIDEGGDVVELAQNLSGIITATNDSQRIMDLMELMAGAPREAMGVRTPGEKTATEVTQLQTAAARIFQEKINLFETELLEPLLNSMLESAKRNENFSETIQVMDTALGARKFKEITREDITANGILRPIGARHFGQKQQDLVNMIQVSNTRLWDTVAPHISGKNLAEFIEMSTNTEEFDIFIPNQQVVENAETQQAANAAVDETEKMATADIGEE